MQENEHRTKPKRIWWTAFLGGGLSSFLIVGLLAVSGMLSLQGLGLSPQAKPVAPAEQVSTTIYAAKTATPAVVGITNMAAVENEFVGTKVVEQGSGSGVIIDPSGIIVTNDHVVEGATELSVSLADGRQVKASVVGRDPSFDLAVLKVRSSGLVAAKLGNSDQLQVGETAIAIGNPLGKEFARSVTVGVISAKDRPVNVGERIFKLIQTDAAINPGNSGGALVNSRGLVVGINSAKLAAPGVEGMGFAIPINDARPIIAEIVRSGKVNRAWMGVKASTIEGPVNDKFDLPAGVLISKVIPGSPADKAGLRRGDVLMAIDGKKVTEMSDLNALLQGCGTGDRCRLEIMRNEQKMELFVEMGQQR